ncbi:MAG: PHP domain-containing protein, partial [candidate division KSB1 bacterium]|nr:PHP domain-containing protein [candidate division KSB1 bacterium]
MKNIIKNYPLTISFILVLVIISVFWHRDIYLLDAVSQKPEPNFRVSIPIVRIIFEPFLGSLLFYSRSHLVLVEHGVLLVWILVGYILWMVGGYFKRRRIPRKGLKTLRSALGFFLRRLAVLPLIVQCFLAIMMVESFVPLPVHRVVSQNPDVILLDCHCHTYYSHDGMKTQQGQIDWHHKNGFQAAFFTDHNHVDPTVKFIIEREKSGLADDALVLLPGEEFSGSSHLLLLGIEQTFSPDKYSDQEVIEEVHRLGGVVIVAHWWSLHKHSIEQFIQWGVDGFELVKQDEQMDYDPQVFQQILWACQTNGLIMLSDSDYHGYGSICNAFTALTIPAWQQMTYWERKEALWEALRNRKASRFQVLVYDDRGKLRRSTLCLSPLLMFVSYFRTLNGFQTLSWMVWIVLVSILSHHLFSKKWLSMSRKGKLQLVGAVGLLVSL